MSTPIIIFKHCVYQDDQSEKEHSTHGSVLFTHLFIIYYKNRNVFILNISGKFNTGYDYESVVKNEDTRNSSKVLWYIILMPINLVLSGQKHG
ncbi:hypothetical protein QTP88_026063 [Uroleucon formosanum]